MFCMHILYFRSCRNLLSITGLSLELLVFGEAGLMKDVSMLCLASPDQT